MTTNQCKTNLDDLVPGDCAFLITGKHATICPLYTPPAEEEKCYCPKLKFISFNDPRYHLRKCSFYTKTQLCTCTLRHNLVFPAGKHYRAGDWHKEDCKLFEPPQEKEPETWVKNLNKQFFGGIPTEQMGSNQVSELELQDFIREVESAARQEAAAKAREEVLDEVLRKWPEEKYSAGSKIIDGYNEGLDDGRLIIESLKKSV